METQVLIDRLKKALKLKGINYGELAGMLGISANSVNRIFYQGTFTLDRFLKICDLIGVPLQDLLQMGDVDLGRKDTQMSVEVEEFFANNPNYLYFHNLLWTYKSPNDLAREYNIDDITLGKLLSQLEKMNLLEWLPGNEVKLKEPRKYGSKDGPIYRVLGKDLAKDLIDLSFSKEKDPGLLLYPDLSINAEKKLKSKLEEVFDQMLKERELESLLKIPTRPVGVLLCVEPTSRPYENLRNLRL